MSAIYEHDTKPMTQNRDGLGDSRGSSGLGISTGEVQEQPTGILGSGESRHAVAASGGNIERLTDEEKSEQIEWILLMIDHKKSSGAPIPSGWINRLGTLQGAPKLPVGEFYSNVIEGHPEYASRFKELEYLIPIKVRSGADLQSRFDRAQGELDRVNRIIGLAQFELSQAKTPAKRKKAQSKVNSLGREIEIQTALRDDIIPELNRLHKAANQA